MILILDHQDSFTYNIYAALKSLGAEAQVLSTTTTSIEDLRALEEHTQALILSPGPGHPSEARLFHQALEAYSGKLPILGVCLGHQVIVQYYGGEITSSQKILHGHSVPVHHDGSCLYLDLPSPFLAMRYNSLEASLKLPLCLQLTSWTEENGQKSVMGVQHVTDAVFGVQFHPESVGTPQGHLLIKQFLQRVQASYFCKRECLKSTEVATGQNR